MRPTASCFLLLVVSLASHALQLRPPATGACVPRERDALLAFKKGITKDPLGRLASWRRGEDCCRWRGVRCSNRTGHVLKLQLRHIPVADEFSDFPSRAWYRPTCMVGLITPSLLSLEHLEHLDLSDNSLEGPTGRFPEFLGSLKSLRYLNLSGIPFTGTLPPQLGNLSNLHYLDLSGIPFTGMLPPQLGNLSNLHYLDLSGIDISWLSTDLSWLRNLPSLQYLNLNWVNLSMAVDWPHIVNMIPSLRVLYLSGCQLQSANQLLPHLNLTKLEKLDLSQNSFYHPSASCWLWNLTLTSLKYLDLSDNNLYGQFPYALSQNSFDMQPTDLLWLTNLPSLHYLNLNGVNLSMAVDWPHIVNMIPSLRVLYLSGCQLQSANQLLPHLNLTKLEKLDLSQNSFYHPSASCWFWSLTSLKYLDLQSSFSYGQFPDALGEMTSLQVFDYSFNNIDAVSNSATAILAPNLLRNLCNLEILNLEESLSSGNITELFESLLHCPSKKLRELHLASNNITGTLPTGMGQFTSLVTLDLPRNKLTGPVPSEITMLTNLTTMDLSYNDLHGVVTEEHFAGLHSLKYIDLSDNHLKIVVGPEWLPPFRPERIYFASCQLGPQFPAWLQRLAGTDRIDISSNGITGQLPDWFSPVFSVTTILDISNNRISGGLPPNMETMSLIKLNIGSNRLAGEIPPLPRNLTALYMSNNALSGRVPGSICKTQKLKVLDLTNNRLEGEFPQCFVMRNAFALLLSNNTFSGKFPSFLQGCSDLAFLDLSNNNFSGRLPVWIGDLMELQYLSLSYNTFYGNIPSSITNLRHLSWLNLAGNRFSGVIPWHLSNLAMMAGVSPDVYYGYDDYNFSVVTKRQKLFYHGYNNYMFSIDLSSNCLIGGIPEDIASLALINLNLSRNCLSGKIPDKIGAMKSLESLDLSRNRLSREIPSSLSNLTSLSCLDLSYNNLSGRIPSGSQLDTLYANNPYMYSGNNGLCGPPLQRNCSGGDGDHKRTTALVPETMFFYLGLVSGFVVGLWMVFCAMLFRKTWRIAYFRFFDKVYDKIYVFVAVTWASLAQKTTAH